MMHGQPIIKHRKLPCTINRILFHILLTSTRGSTEGILWTVVRYTWLRATEDGSLWRLVIIFSCGLQLDYRTLQP